MLDLASIEEVFWFTTSDVGIVGWRGGEKRREATRNDEK
jgi:hypothetical protein